MKENIDNHLKDDRGAIILKYDTISVVFFYNLDAATNHQGINNRKDGPFSVLSFRED